jgi:hypothetical protein
MMRAKNSWLFVLIVACGLSAQDIRISGANRAEYWVFVDENLDSLNYKEHFTEKLKLSAHYKDISLNGVFFSWDPSLSIHSEFRYFDFTVQYQKDPVNILYGTYYVTFGRGLCLNQFLDEDFNNDNSLFGLKADLKFFNSQLTLLTGAPRNIFFEELTYSIKNDTSDQIRGVNLETKVPLPKTAVNVVLTAAARYVRINQLSDYTPTTFTELYGGNIGLTIGPWDGYVEYGRQWGMRPVEQGGGRLQGDGWLATTGLALPGFGVSFQYVNYDTIGFNYRTLYRYNEPPTPIKSGISVNRGLDEIGYGVTLVASPIDFFSLEIQSNKVAIHQPDASALEEIFVLPDRAGVLEYIGKLTMHPSYDVEVSIGVERVVKRVIELPIERKVETKPYIEATYDLGLFYVEAGYEHMFVSSDTSDYYDHAFSISLGKPEMFVLSLRYERRNRVPEWLILKLGEETAWPMLELSLDLTQRHNVRVRVGAEKGGLVCSGGVCRFEEPFKGVKVVLTSVF